MTWRITSPVAGMQRITDFGTTQQHALGTIVTASDETYGVGEFIYLLGVGSTVAGSVVNWSLVTHQTALAVAGNDISRPLAVAMSACVASNYGWYQISGFAVTAKSAAVSFAVGDGVGIATAGVINVQASTTGVVGAVVVAVASATTSATTVLCHIQRPCMGVLED
jgi:hypothetical protein